MIYLISQFSHSSPLLPMVDVTAILPELYGNKITLAVLFAPLKRLRQIPVANLQGDVCAGMSTDSELVTDNRKYYYQYMINTQFAITLDEMCAFVKECLENNFEPLREVL